MAEVNTYLDIKDLNKSIGDLILFENASLSIAERQRRVNRKTERGAHGRIRKEERR